MKEIILLFVTIFWTILSIIVIWINDVLLEKEYLKEAIFLAGLLHLGVLVAGVIMTKVLRWKKEFQKIDKLSEHIIWTHGAYVFSTVLFFGIVSLLWPEVLFEGHILGIVLSVFITLFWGVRLFIQLFYFDPKPYLTNIVLKIGFHTLTLSFLYFTVVYGWSAYKGIMG